MFLFLFYEQSIPIKNRVHLCKSTSYLHFSLSIIWQTISNKFQCDAPSLFSRISVPKYRKTHKLWCSLYETATVIYFPHQFQTWTMPELVITMSPIHLPVIKSSRKREEKNHCREPVMDSLPIELKNIFVITLCV